MRFSGRTQLRIYGVVSLVLVILSVLGIGYLQAKIYRDAFMQREGNDIRDIVQALSFEFLAPSDIVNFRETYARQRLKRVFSVIGNLSGVLTIRVYDMDHQVIWSDVSSVIGDYLDSPEESALARQGKTVVAFYPAEDKSSHHRYLPHVSMVEFHVPLYMTISQDRPPRAKGMVAVFRSASAINATLERGIRLIWLATVLGGLVLFFALAIFFRSLQRQKLDTERQVTELVSRQQQKERMIQMEKLSAIGLMVGEIAHQINNPLVGVLNMAQLAEREIGNPEHLKELLASIRRAGEDCRSFVKRMLEFTTLSSSDSDLQPTELRGLLKEAIALFHQSSGNRTRVSLEVPDRPVVLEVDPILLRHAVFNLLTNSMQAATEPSEIVVRLAPATGDDGRSPGWRLSVIDNGPGIPEKTLDKVFTPFFSTRPDGTGLGLWVVQQVAILHGGTVRATNHPEGGAILALWLPGGTQGGSGDQ